MCDLLPGLKEVESTLKADFDVTGGVWAGLSVCDLPGIKEIEGGLKADFDVTGGV